MLGMTFLGMKVRQCLAIQVRVSLTTRKRHPQAIEKPCIHSVAGTNVVTEPKKLLPKQLSGTERRQVLGRLKE